jgi:hypothetical protein
MTGKPTAWAAGLYLLPRRPERRVLLICGDAEVEFFGLLDAESWRVRFEVCQSASMRSNPSASERLPISFGRVAILLRVGTDVPDVKCHRSEITATQVAD